ncbi:MAG: flagellar basal body P-ring formation chaperone FlgA [Pseudomonadota bacterium]|nr:flagellar basal body P-ring formation chaperone FlgA [Pseudomonadota bacterium]
MTFSCHFQASSILRNAVVTTALAFTAADASSASLRHHVVIRDHVVRLSDIFSDAGKHSDRIVLQPPAPGKKLVLNAQWLYRAARAYGVDWKPFSKLDQVVLERSIIRISTEQIREAIGKAVRHQIGKNKNFEIELDNQVLQMHLPGEAMPSVQIRRLMLDQRSRRFSALLLGGEGKSRGSQITATGRYHRIVEIPVFVRRMRSNDVIDRSDIRLVTFRADRIDRNALQDVEDLVGMSPLRTLSADRPVKRDDIRAPVLVPKGSIVTMVFRTEQMVLTAQGRALQAGSQGDVIRIRNAMTHKIIDGKVMNSSTVTVKPLNRLALRQEQ